MNPLSYPMPAGVHAVPEALLDLRPDSEIDYDILHPKPVSSSEKNVWFFWHSGYENMYPYTKRNIRAWYRRFSKSGWAIRVLDRDPGSALNVSHFLDVEDRTLFPRAFAEGTITGTYALQHMSDLVRLPLLLRYGGVYADVGLLQIGDLDRLWEETLGAANPTSSSYSPSSSTSSPYEVLAYNIGGVSERSLANYFLASRRDNPLFARSHRLLLALWGGEGEGEGDDGGRTSTEGMSASPLLRGPPLMGSQFSDEATRRELTDYIVQGQALSLAMGLVDDEDGWDGPRYCADRVYAIDHLVGSQLVNELTAWDGRRAFDLMSLPLPRGEGEPESADQRQAREIVEGCLARSFGFKLATGLILKVLGPTLSSLWRENEGSDDVPGTYAHWLRHGTMYWTQDQLPDRLDFQVIEPYKRGALLRER
ncbi:capsule polysaccharide biosynthesis protein [Biscogniauxia sp. FL1348]|nr:capsule polysaccharide biosynthesis protein [Biscogniauxia sp. FL1348]